MKYIHLIQCGDHQWAPYSILCKHLMDGESTDWMAMNSSNPEIDYDFVCPDCLVESMDKGWHAMAKSGKLKLVCIHCVRLLEEKYAPNIDLDGLTDEST